MNDTIGNSFIKKAFTITFDPSGGTMPGTSIFGVDAGERFSSIFNALPVAVKPGYILNSWLCEKTGYNLSLTDGRTFSENENITFTAQWIKNPSAKYQISFYPVLKNATGIPAAITFPEGTVTLPSEMPFCPGWAFVGWNESGSALDHYYTPGQTYPLTKNVILRGIWISSNADSTLGIYGFYAVYYSPNGGTWGKSDASFKRSPYQWGLLQNGNYYYFPDETPTLQRPGYRMHTSEANMTIPRFYTGNGIGSTMLGGNFNNGYEYDTWPDGLSTFVLNSTQVPYGTNIILYACWDPVITYDMNDASGITLQDFNYITSGNAYKILPSGGYTRYSSSSEANESKDPDGNNSLLPNREGYVGHTQIPKRPGCTLTGWNTEPDGSGTKYKPGQTYDVTEPLILYAQWKTN